MAIIPKEVHTEAMPLGVWTFITVMGDSEVEAMEYLQQQDSIPLFTYIAVETPEGIFCRDIAGFYKEE